MPSLKQSKLKPILESRNGIHLTAYLVNRGNLSDLKSQLRIAINQSCEWLSNVMSTEERNKFLEPIQSLLRDPKIFTQIKGNIGIFRNQESFRILNIPIEIEQSCQVATSFHVKPLLRWLQGDQEFLFLGIEKESAHLYLGCQNSFKLLDSIQWKGSVKAQTFIWINEWISEFTKIFQPRLFLSGSPELSEKFISSLNYKSIVKTSVQNSFDPRNAFDTCQMIRRILKDESKRSLERALLEFRFAEAGHRAKKNIFQIAKAVVQGKVRKLIVTDELSIFGKIDPQSGGLAIHPFDLDHEDDCILDDLAQMVLSQGGEVVIAKRNEIPKGRPILAILDDEEDSLEKTGEFEYEALHERFS